MDRNEIIIVSNHACDRLHERSGLNKKSMQRMAETAFYEGIKHSETNGTLNKYISYLSNKTRRKGFLLRLYGDKTFIFINEKQSDGNDAYVLVTVLQTPKEYLKAVTKLMKKKKETVA